MVESEIIARFILAVVLNVPIGLIAAKMKSLSFPRGFLTAGIIAVCTYFLFPPGWVALVLFFTSSAILSSISSVTKKKAKSIQEKGECRDQYQILANSVIALMLSIIYFVNNGVCFILIDTVYVSVFVALSASTADTWGTEVGMMAKKEPRYILNPGRTVPAGTSGGITFLGTIASIAGSAIIAVLFIILTAIGSLNNLYSSKIWIYSVLILVSGFLGQIVDSFLGATVQSTYQCINCHAMIESGHHYHCDTRATRIKGIAGFNNDWVNLTSTAIVTVLYIIVAIIVPL